MKPESGDMNPAIERHDPVPIVHLDFSLLLEETVNKRGIATYQHVVFNEVITLKPDIPAFPNDRVEFSPTTF